MGEVLLAQDTSLGRLIKVINDALDLVRAVHVTYM
jgi:hypothetical protein